MPKEIIPPMRNAGFHLSEFSKVTPLTRPLLEQLIALQRHMMKCQKKLDRMLALPHVGGDSNRIGARTPEIEERILRQTEVISKNAYQIWCIQSKMKDGHFNRNSVPKARSVRPDKGKIVYSKSGNYTINREVVVKSRQSTIVGFS